MDYSTALQRGLIKCSRGDGFQLVHRTQSDLMNRCMCVALGQWGLGSTRADDDEESFRSFSILCRSSITLQEPTTADSPAPCRARRPRRAVRLTNRLTPSRAARAHFAANALDRARNWVLESNWVEVDIMKHEPRHFCCFNCDLGCWLFTSSAGGNDYAAG